MAEKSGILIKIDKNKKRQMKKLDLNWSAEIRDFIDSRLKASPERNLALAVALNDRLFRRSKAKKINSTQIIRKFREERYGPGSD